LKYDRKWDNDRGFVFYDFNAPEDIAEEHKEQYDLVIVDPPFITSEVWNKYAETVKYLLREGNNDDGKYWSKMEFISSFSRLNL
jgi:16S rRNA G966 N2-methylase RsmD